MAWWNFLTSSEKVVTTATDLVKDASAGIDMLFFTDEEKSKASLQVMQSVIDFQKATTDENSVRSRTRRILAVGILGNYMTLINLCAVMELLNKHENSKFLFELANEALGAHVLAVVIFYFGWYGISRIMGKGK